MLCSAKHMIFHDCPPLQETNKARNAIKKVPSLEETVRVRPRTGPLPNHS
jgi:hypothetical protein